MAMKSSTWKSESASILRGVGVDAERIARFHRQDPSRNPLPLVFTPLEIRRSAALPDPSAGLCAAFCFKEALFKALGRPIDPLEAQWLTGDRPDEGEARLGPGLVRELAVAGVEVLVLFPLPDECVTIVHVFGEEP